MRRRALVLGVATVGLLTAGAVWLYTNPGPAEEVFRPRAPVEAPPLCPWRQPEADLRALFAGATGYQTETRILSGQRVELAERLGRAPEPDEHSLHLYRVRAGEATIGTVLTRRVKGEFGAIELVLAVDPDGRVRAVRLQRLREPQPAAAALENADWLGQFAGGSTASDWRLGGLVPTVPSSAAASAQAIVDGVRGLLILLDVAEHSSSVRTRSPHH
jgi:hypothetical protein